MHKVMGKIGGYLPVDIKFEKVPVRTITKSRVGETMMDIATLPLSSWFKASINLGGHFFFGGKSLDHIEGFMEILDKWWRNYRMLDPDHPCFCRDGQDVEEQFKFWIPIALHGDEGRGRYKRPIMICSYQPVLTNFKDLPNLKGWELPKVVSRIGEVFDRF